MEGFPSLGVSPLASKLTLSGAGAPPRRTLPSCCRRGLHAFGGAPPDGTLPACHIHTRESPSSKPRKLVVIASQISQS
jgi:hypothetical protein